MFSEKDSTPGLCHCLQVKGDIDNAISWGAGAVLNKKKREEMLEQDPAQGVEAGEWVGRVVQKVGAN